MTLKNMPVPPLSRGIAHAALNGTIREFTDTAAHAAQWREAGENVLPFPLRRRWPRRAVATSDLTPQEIEAIRTAEMPPEYEHLDAELEGWDPHDK